MEAAGKRFCGSESVVLRLGDWLSVFLSSCKELFTCDSMSEVGLVALE